MKKKITTTLLGLLFCIAANSQVDPHAIGLRIGGGESFEAELSYLHGLGEMNRLELDLGYGTNSDYNRYKLSGTYQWVFNLERGLNWYIGPGANVSYNDGKDWHDNHVGVGIGGQIGVGYNFANMPLQLTVDARPMWNFISDDDDNNFGWGFALGVRYRF